MLINSYKVKNDTRIPLLVRTDFIEEIVLKSRYDLLQDNLVEILLWLLSAQVLMNHRQSY